MLELLQNTFVSHTDELITIFFYQIHTPQKILHSKIQILEEKNSKQEYSILQNGRNFLKEKPDENKIPNCCSQIISQLLLS